jgi:hypothetical protein
LYQTLEHFSLGSICSLHHFQPCSTILRIVRASRRKTKISAMERWMKKRLACLVSSLVITGMPGPWACGAEQGEFEGKVVVEPLDEPFVPSIRVVEDFGFRQATGKFWKVSRGEAFHGKGWPPLLCDLVGSPYEGKFRDAALVYESATQRRTEKWDEAQRMLFEASITEGVAPQDAKVMYLLLAVQGSRWEVPDSRCFGSCHGVSGPLEWRPVINEAKTEELVNWVRGADPDIEEIDRRAQSAIRAKGPHIFTQPPCDMFSGSTRVRKRCD